jgi:hypothetical protein
LFLKKRVSFGNERHIGTNRLDGQGLDVTRFFDATDMGGAAEELEGFRTEGTCSLLKLGMQVDEKREALNAPEKVLMLSH